jgi:lipopolysaccharide heptosyltransferase II
LNILLIRLRLIGDVVFTTPVIRALRARYPDARLSYLVEPSAAPIVAGNPALTDIITVPYSRGWRRIRDDLRLGADLRRRGFDLVIDLHGGPRSAWLSWASRAPVRVGYDVPGRSWMYTRVVHRPRHYRPRHAVQNQWDLLRVVDPAFDRPMSRVQDRVEMPVDRDALARVSRALADLGVPSDARLLVLHVSAGNPFRRWPEASFAEVASSLCGADARRWVLVTAGPSDRDAAARVIAQARDRAGARAAGRIVSAEHFTLTELRAVLERAALFIGGDSGPLHIAATSDAPIVGIYGPTLPERSEPWRPPALGAAAVDAGALPCRPCDQRQCTPGDFRCLTRIDPGSVARAANGLLEATP